MATILARSGLMSTDVISVRDARSADAVGRKVRVQGWVRTWRDSKAGFSFPDVNDESCLATLQ
jgi:asparaginyl-tRNA synthetase